MYGDKIKCINCGKISIDTTEVKMQDSRNGKFKNMCPFCFGTNTVNLHKDTKAKDKFIYNGELIRREEAHTKSNKRIKKPDLEDKTIVKEVLGDVQPFDISEESISPSRIQPRGEPIKDEDWYTKRGISLKVSSLKPFTPLELMQQKLKNQHEELKSKPNNYKLYRGWHYHRRIKKC